MKISPDVKVTSQILWRGALIFSLIDIVFVPLLAWLLGSATFRQIKWALIVTTAIFWFILWAWMLYIFWEPVYHYVFPGWARWLIPLLYGPLFAAVSLLFWELALRIPGNPVVNFCILGGLWGVITHVWAIYRGILSKPPMLQGAAPVAALVIALFEFIFYWCIILSVASLLQYSWHWLRG